CIFHYTSGGVHITQYSAAVVQLLLHFWWCTQYTIQCNHSAVATTFLVVYTLHNTVQPWCSCYYTSGGIHSTQYSAAVLQLLLLFWGCTQYTIQCSVVLQNKIYIMSGRPPRRGRRSQASKRGQAGSVPTVNSAGCGHGASSAGGRGARLSFFPAAGRVIKLGHAEELVEWKTKLSSSSSSSVIQAQSSLPSNAAAKAAYSTGFLSTESPKLFDHSVGHMLMEDAQGLEGSDVGSQVEEGSKVSLERRGAQSDRREEVEE
ncbi:hypothetical protein AB205_0214500, partial [Aquarana catesbeiana]